jgi:hypothetical protein
MQLMQAPMIAGASNICDLPTNHPTQIRWPAPSQKSIHYLWSGVIDSTGAGMWDNQSVDARLARVKERSFGASSQLCANPARTLPALAALATGLHLAIARAQAGRAKRYRTDTLARGILVRAVSKTGVRSSVRKLQLGLKYNARVGKCRSDQGQYKCRRAICDLH